MYFHMFFWLVFLCMCEGREAHEEINITFTLPASWNSDECVLHGHCEQVVFSTCMTVAAASNVFPVTVWVGPTSQTHDDVWEPTPFVWFKLFKPKKTPQSSFYGRPSDCFDEVCWCPSSWKPRWIPHGGVNGASLCCGPQAAAALRAGDVHQRHLLVQGVHHSPRLGHQVQPGLQPAVVLQRSHRQVVPRTQPKAHRHRPRRESFICWKMSPPFSSLRLYKRSNIFDSVCRSNN